MILMYIKGISKTQTRNIKKLPFILLLLLSSAVYAQHSVWLTKGLIVSKAHQYGREALFKDRLAYEIYNKTLKTPAVGETAFLNEKGEAVKWKAIAANGENKFKDSLLYNGYLYLTYDSEKEQTALINITGHGMVYVNGVPRSGDIYNSGWLDLPVMLKKGLNEFFIRSSRFSIEDGIAAKISFPSKSVSLNTGDPTLPYIVLGRGDKTLLGAVAFRCSSRYQHDRKIPDRSAD
jgi:hypothetical protein